jgi:peptide/nickel transport system substrate-binding protein
VASRPLALALALLAVLTACTRVAQTDDPNAARGASPGPARNPKTIAHVLRIGEVQDVSGLNPHIVAETSLGNMSQLTMAYLVRYDAHNAPIPELATVVPTQKNGGISKDGRTITWHLRTGVRWSDGAPFDADDVVFSTNAVNNPKNNEIGRDGWDKIVKIDEPDKYTVVYHLKEPYSGYLPSFFGTAGANPCILPKHILGSLAEINDAPYNSKPVGIGPYRYVSWKRGESVELEANPYYWRGQPKIKKITIRFIPDRNTMLTLLQTGEIDIWPYVGTGYLGRAQAIPGVRVAHFPSYYYAHVDFNVKHPGVSDPVVRRALRMATDRAGIIAKVNHGSGILQENQITPVSTLYTAIPLVPFDVAGANKLLDAAGWVRGADGVRAKNGVKLALTFATTTGTPDADQAIEAIRATWKEVGVTFQVKRYQPALFFGPYSSGGTLFTGKFDVTSFSWGQTPDGDYTPTLGCAQIPPGGENVTNFCDPVSDALLDRSKAAYDEDARRAVMHRLALRVSDLVPYYVLDIREDIHAYNTDLQGWHPNSSSPFDDFMNVDI